MGNEFDLVEDELAVKEPGFPLEAYTIRNSDEEPGRATDGQSFRLIPYGKRGRSMVGAAQIAIERNGDGYLSATSAPAAAPRRTGPA